MMTAYTDPQGDYGTVQSSKPGKIRQGRTYNLAKLLRRESNKYTLSFEQMRKNYFLIYFVPI